MMAKTEASEVGKTTKIVVAGDVTIDRLQWMVKHGDNSTVSACGSANWTSYQGIRTTVRPGGALLLAEFIEFATGKQVVTHKLRSLRGIAPDKIIHSIATLGEYPISSKDANLVYRIAQFCGYEGPLTGIMHPQILTGDFNNADLVILDDAGNGFRDDESVWGELLETNKQATIIVKMCRPLSAGKLWDYVTSSVWRRLIVIVSADDMRECGANISRRLSWERTAQDFVRQMTNNPQMQKLAACPELIVRFGIDAAIYRNRQEGKTTTRLFYDPTQSENSHLNSSDGDMHGLASSFTAALSAKLLSNSAGTNDIADGIKSGINSARRLISCGFGEISQEPDYPGKEIFESSKSDPFIAEVVVPNPATSTPDAPANWTILEDFTRNRLEVVAYNTVCKGSDDSLRSVPVAQFGKFTAIDRVEIESYQSVRNLMVEYVGIENPERPLSIAVFGSPGSGKSFGVTELTKSIAKNVERIEYNVSQFESVSDLCYALHAVRDKVLEGKLPLVFFDEFDSGFDGELGWLKYFLAPMQDGKFKHGEQMHPIGKAIFVFAGGTSHTFQKFYPDTPSEERKPVLIGAKVPDFVSRLRGYIDIMGPNPRDEEDRFFMIRRAMLLRFMLKSKAKHIFKDNDAQVDRGVLRALIKTSIFKHGVRSIQAILDMSQLSGRRCYEQAALPSKEQLKLHVDADMFRKLVLTDVLLAEAREKLGKAFHEQYRKDMENSLPADSPATLPWESLKDQDKESNLGAADNIPHKLAAVDCGSEPVTGEGNVSVTFTDVEIEILAKIEHERWMSQKIAQGWAYGDPRDNERKLHPCIVEWDVLPEKEKEKDRQSARAFPEFLAKAGFDVYRLP